LNGWHSEQMDASAENEKKSKLFTPQSWGLPSAEIKKLGQRLYEFWERYADCFETTTRDTSHYALSFLSGLLRMTTERNFSNIARVVGASPQNVQHFMTNSPWSAQEVLQQIREEVAQEPSFAEGSALILDESADEKASEKTVGAGRQHNGRLGKIDMSQVGTFLAYAHNGDWMWIDGELFLPEGWFTPQMAKERKRLGVPSDRKFATKVQLGWQMIERVSSEGMRFEAVCCDTLYGRSFWLRRKLSEAHLIYYADVPVHTQVYLERPVVDVPAHLKGRRKAKPRVLSEDKPMEVRQISGLPETVWRRIEVRATERGYLKDEFSARRVWTTQNGEQPVEEWLIMRRDGEGKIHYALSNEPAEATLERLAWGKCQRVFVECANRDAKSEIGWDELRAQKFPAWEHELALVCLATWFMTQTKLEWRERHPRDPELARELGVDNLAALSMANTRELLRAAIPLPQMTIEGATNLVIEHLINRTRSRKSRLKTLGHKHSPT
jgi:SRSO17 transposase